MEAIIAGRVTGGAAGGGTEVEDGEVAEGLELEVQEGTLMCVHGKTKIRHSRRTTIANADTTAR